MHTRSACDCMTFQYFKYCCDRYYRSILICLLHQCLIPHGDHLTSMWQIWIQRLERKVGWSYEAAEINDKKTARKKIASEIYKEKEN